MHIDWQHLIHDYGYLAILAGTFLEGESILIVGGYAAHEGYLALWAVLLSAFLGSFLGDQLYFAIGRLHGRAFLARRPAWAARIARVHQLLERYQTAYILGFRFLYGLRTISPFVLGAGRVPTARFVLLNAVGAILWTLSVGSLGYLFGQVLTMLLGRAKHYEAAIVGSMIVACAVAMLVLRRRTKR